jgi:hypothetical protein
MEESEMSHFIEAQLEVETLVMARGEIDGAEDFINEDPRLDDEQKSALWLFGWSLLPPHRQRQMAMHYMQQLEGDRWSAA